MGEVSCRQPGRRRSRRGFTMVELLTALLVSSIILGAVASLAYAFTSAHGQTGRQSEAQATVRFASLRIREAVRRSNSVLSASATSVELWADADADGVVDAAERSTIQVGADGVSLEMVNNGVTTKIVKQCSNVQFVIDQPVPGTRMVGVLFDLVEDGRTQRYEVSAGLQCRPDHV